MPFVPDKQPSGRFVPDNAPDQSHGGVDNFSYEAAGAVAEPILSLGSNFLLAPFSGLAGAAALPFVGSDRAADIVNKIQSYAYQPKTTAGTATTNAVSYPFRKLGDLASYIAEGAQQPGLLEKATGVETPKPFGTLGATLLNTAVQTAIPGRKNVGGASDLGASTAGRAGAQAPEAAAQAGRAPGLGAVSEAAPSAEALRTSATAAYKRARESGAVVTPESFAAEKARLASSLQREGLDPTLTPKATAALKRIVDTEGPVSLDQIETLRKIARHAEADINPITHQPTPDARLGGQIVDAIDEFTSSLKPDQLTAGTPEAAAAFKEARSLYSRAAKSNDIAYLIDRAQTKAGAHYTQAGMEHAVRQEFKSLALNPQRLRFFTKEEQAAIKAIARGSPMENIVRAVGKFDPTNSGVASLPSIMAVLAAGPGGLALPAAGFAARRLATRMTANKVQALDEMVRRGNALSPAEAARRNALAESP